MSGADVERRLEAIGRLGAAASREDLEWLVACFEHPQKAVQRRAGETVAALAVAGVSVADALEAAMSSGSFHRRWVAAWAACRGETPWPPRARPILLEALGSQDGDVRWAAARLLMAWADDREDAVDADLLRLAEHGTAEQRKMAFYCLRERGVRGPDAVARYRAGLADPVAGVRLAALAAVVRTDDASSAGCRAIAERLTDPEPGVRRAAAAGLARLRCAHPEVRTRLAAIVRASDDPMLVRLARAALGATA